MIGFYSIKSVKTWKPICSTKQTKQKPFLSISDVLPFNSLSPSAMLDEFGGQPPSRMKSEIVWRLQWCILAIVHWHCTLVTSCGESHIPMAKRQHGKVTSGSGKSHQKRTNKVAQHVSSLQYKYWKWLQYQNQALSTHTAPKPWNNTSIKSHGDLKRTASRYDFLQADIT